MDIDLAKKTLIDKNLKLCVVKNGKIVFESRKNGIVPMYDLYKSNIKGNLAIADRFIGGGALRFIMEIGCDSIFSFVMSKDAINTIRENNIDLSYDRKVDKILNRTGDDLCPVEKISRENYDFKDFLNNLESFLIKTHQI